MELDDRIAHYRGPFLLVGLCAHTILRTPRRTPVTGSSP